MRLIDADVLMEQLVSKHAHSWGKVERAYGEAIEALCNAPTVDAEPVRHASLKETGFDEAWCNWGDCTKCGTSNIFGSKYCNECGAKMDGGAK